MKIYKLEYNSWNNRLAVCEIEAEEKPKTYVFTKKDRCVWEERISKEDVGKLLCRYGYKMFSLHSDTSEFLKLLIEQKEKNIHNLEQNLQRAREEKEKIQKLLDEQEVEG